MGVNRPSLLSRNKSVRMMWNGGKQKEESAKGEEPMIEVYTDGSARKGKAEWGMVVVVEGEESEARKGPVIDAKQTNNTGEVMAVQQAVRWAVEQNQSIKIRHDSEYATSMVQGKWKQKKNKELIERVRKEYVEATRQIRISWEWVKGHSNDKWNDRADELADQGANMCEGKGTGRGMGRGEETQDEQSPLKESEACMKGEVRWVTYRPTEATRVLRSRTRHGCLNKSALRQRSIPRGEVSRLEKQSLKHTLREARMGLVSWSVAKKANEKLERAGKDMRDPAIQKRERQERKRQIHTREVWCKVNMEAIDHIAKGGDEDTGEKMDGDGEKKRGRTKESWSKTVQDDAVELSQRAIRGKDGVGRIRLAYHYSEKGRDLL